MQEPRKWVRNHTSAGDRAGPFHRPLVLALVIAVGAVLWHHTVSTVVLGQSDTFAGHAQYALLGVMLAIPFAMAAVWVSRRIVGPTRTWAQHATLAAVLSLVYGALLVPFMALQMQVEELGSGTGGAAHHGMSMSGTSGAGLAGLVEHGARQALVTQPFVFVLALLTTGLILSPIRLGDRRERRRIRVGLIAATTALVTTSPLAQASAEDSGPAAQSTGGTISSVGSCTDAATPKRTYDVVAMDVDIPLNRFGDHDPFGYMYALESQVPAIRAFERAVNGTDANGNAVGATAKVSHGLENDPIQPLVLRARLGDCVIVNLDNDIVNAPRGGPGATPVVQPGGPPSVSIDIQGVAYKAGEGGNAVGNNPNTMVAPGASRQYRFYVDPLMGEGARVFHSGGESRQLTAHGLFGSLIAEPAGSRWYDTRTGAETTNNANWSSWDAMIQPPTSPAFREFAIMYHEVGDENFNVRQPRVPGVAGFGATSPMVDAGITQSYRPGSRGINYRSESFWRRLTEMGQVAFPGNPGLLTIQKTKKALTYGSYSFGDPATPIPTSYLGEPTKTRLMHAGSEQLHVHHLHGGGDRWRANPKADDPNAMFGGLTKNPNQNATSIRLDSQTVGPDEAYSLEHECGAGGCQQAAGDFLYHCHIAQHYIAGMWSFWRVLDTAQAGLAPLPTKSRPAAAVPSDQLIGRTFEGKTIVANSATPTASQIRLRDWVEPQLPPRGTPNGNDDATVWDWTTDPANSAVYLGEPETSLVWSNYQSAAPGIRPQILFNPTNGRYAWPLVRPHLAQRPPFSPSGHGGAPWLGENTTAARPDGLCPTAPRDPVNVFNVTAINTPIQNTEEEIDQAGRIFVLAENKSRVTAQNAEPLVIRSSVGDCVAVTLTSELDTASQPRVNMHTHFVQFDPQASDGVITGFSYEQSVANYRTEGTAGAGRALQVAAGAGTTTVTVSDVGGLRAGIFFGVGLGTNGIEIRRITGISGNSVTLDRPLAGNHPAGEFAGVEFVQYRWFSDSDTGTVFWHDHVDGISSWAHGLFGAHIIEPRGSTFHDPVTNAQIRSGSQAIIRTDGTVGVDHAAGADFREFMIFLGNGRRGRPELSATPLPTSMNLNFGQECEESSINLRAAPVWERAPEAQQHEEWGGGVCRNGIVVGGVRTHTPHEVSTTDPYLFSSVRHGDPRTPLLRAYAGDPVVIRTLGINERVEALRIAGHRFKRERFNNSGEVMDSGTTGISERFDYVLEGGAGGPTKVPGDYMYYSTRNFALNSGGWGIFRVYDTLQKGANALAPLGTPPPDRAGGFPQRTVTGQPPTGWTSGTDSAVNPCTANAPLRKYDVSIFDVALPGGRSIDPDPDDDPATDDAGDGRDKQGVIYALSSQVSSIRANPNLAEPLVLRANVGDCVEVNLTNAISASAGNLAGERASFSLAKVRQNAQRYGGVAVGFNPDTTVARGQSYTYRFMADKDLGTSIFQNMASPSSLMHGAYGLFVTEPTGSQWFDSQTGARIDNSVTNGVQNRTGTRAIIRANFGLVSFREFALALGTTDQHYGRSIVPYWETVAGTGQASVNGGNPPAGNFPVGHPRRDRIQPGFNHINYKTANTLLRVQSDADNFGEAYLTKNLDNHRDPETPILEAYAGDTTVLRVGVPASNQFHSFKVQGHVFPWEPKMWDDRGDFRSQLLMARSLTAGETLDVELVGGAGTELKNAGDYQYGDGRMPWTQGGIWGLLRVLPSTTTGGPAKL